ncbi:E3 ubiquitin-protein ligase RNF180 [Lingula anatina]|uniref:E3 ubiquitin-protein ligase RNF180 n=1 Tax=Lingula anatina TaxID=7574 RepID=A0A1S3JYF3_LINAN|nr:E3 ubiquitin-protein ligase RNF180 [Lingula anatina]|eukprot:XP_013415066.1 E3 ubiquitin-protein ligase RNF180 [Lingula anatina]
MTEEKYKCRMCRHTLTSSRDISDLDCNTSSSLIWLREMDSLEGPQWILDQLLKGGWTKGKLTCPKCGGKVGGFDFISPSRCSCGLHMNPFIYLTANRVDRDRPVSVPQSTPSAAPLAQRPVITREESGGIVHLDGGSENLAIVSAASDDIDHLLQSDLIQASSDGGNTSLRYRNRERTEHSVSERNADAFNQQGVSVEANGASQSGDDSHRLHGAQEGAVTNSDTLLHSSDSELSDSSVSSWILETSSSPTSQSEPDETWTNSDNLHSSQNNFTLLVQSGKESDNDCSDSVDEKNNELGDLELIKQMEGLTCSICLDLYYRPHSCYPCRHVFCESCLRQIANSSSTDTVCPLCRTEIKKCILHEDLERQIKTTFPEDYKCRLKEGRKLRLKHMPLPRRRWNPGLDLEYQQQLSWNSYKTELAVVFMLFFVVAILALSSFPMVMVLHGGEP